MENFLLITPRPKCFMLEEVLEWLQCVLTYMNFRTLKTGRKVTFWYGGRSKRELFYLDHFKALEKDFNNFKFYVALSEPMDEDNWKVKDGLDGDGDGFKGFVHQCVIDNYLNHHEAPEDIEVYFCGPPLMNQAVEKMADDFGIPPENIRFDDFGGLMLKESEIHQLAMKEVGDYLVQGWI